MGYLHLFPNLLSLLRIILTPVIFLQLLMGGVWVFASMALFTIAALTDLCDGYIARKYCSTSQVGNFLDPLADKCLVLSTFAAFWWLGCIELWMIIVIAFRDFFVTGLRIFMEYHGKTVVTSNLGKCKTVSQIVGIYSLFILTLYKVSFQAGSGMALVQMLSLVFVYPMLILTIWSGLSYFYENSKCLITVFDPKR